jgi:eukaryotic-like serine/threonine-protein kinase
LSETISPNTSIAQYTIVSKIGEGGMGEVWRARDPKLGRDVAIKVLPAALSADKDRLARFEQEAQAAGALNHPNILSIFHIGTHEGAPFIVSELLEGEELRDRLDDGTIPLRKATEYAQQIVSGLSAAHEKGIVHRDLKPENLFITKDDRIKILDFGIAKLSAAPASTNSDISEDATRKVLTNPGMVMGTVGYMAPEQVRGQSTDHRSDIFSFGAILHEMLTGRRAFKRETMAETMTAILKEEPEDLSASLPNISPSLERIVRRCLEKKPERRFQSTHDLGFALEALSAPTSASGGGLTAAANVAVAETTKSVWRGRTPWLMAGVFALLAAAGFGLWYFSRSSTGARAIWLAFSPPPSLAFNDKEYDYAVISPDGQKIAFTAYSPEGKSILYLADLNSPDAKPLPGTDDALEPFWSPDSRSIAFGSQGKLKRVDVAGGNSRVICAAARMTGGAWSKTGVIVFGPDYGQPLFRVSADGGEPEQVTVQDTTETTVGLGHRYPNFLPDGRHFVFTRQGVGIWAGSLDSREVKQVVPENSAGVYVDGRLLYVRNQLLVAQEFDASSMQLKGEAVPIAPGTVVNATGQVRFSVSETGVLIFQGDWQREYQLIWFDREGKQVGAIGKPELRRIGLEPHVSPDGKRMVFKRDGIWTSDLNGENAIRMGPGQLPAWYPDSSRVVFAGTVQGKIGIWERTANGVGDPLLLLEGVVFPKAISPDGRFLIYMYRGVKTRSDVWVLPRTGDGKPFPILQTAADELQPELSPDGKWLAYISDESGSYEIYVQSFTAEGKLGAERKRISSNGGIVPNWSSDGKELFYVDRDGQMMAVAVNTSGAEFQKGATTALFKTRMFADASVFHEFAVSHDGQRFLVGTLLGDTKSPRPTVILNWPAALKK